MNFPEIDINNLEKTFGEFGMLGLSFLWKALLFIVIIFVGFKLVKFIEKRFFVHRAISIINPTVYSFLRSLGKIGMQVLVIFLPLEA